MGDLRSASAGGSGASQTGGYSFGGASNVSGNYACGGGGGYYGGKGATRGGGGGSSFISGYAGCNAIDSSGAHTGQPNHYSGKVFINGSMTAGANTGNGKAQITWYGTEAPSS